SHAIDVCVDFVGRDGVKDMTELVSRIVRQVDCPLMLDSTDPAVIEAGLKLAPGKCIVNSINLENGESRFEDICPLLQRFGAAAVALTIDEDPQEGMAKTAARKLEIAARIHRLFTEKWHCDSRDLLFDPLTFTTCTGNDDDRRLALETLNAIEMIAKHFPECGILLGISNVSFGLRPAARVVLNSAFMHEAIQRGLTAAIVHASGILPRTRISDERWQAALDLIYDRRTENRDPLLHFISLFPESESSSTSAEEMKALPIEEQLQRHIIDGEKEGLTEHLQTALQKYSPLEIINDHLLAGMKVVGELFGSGALQLPFVLQSAEVMKMAVTHLEPHMQKSDTGNKGTIILATVRGDVHDIGKNLVDIILTNNGYKVVNLGIKQQINAIVDAFREHEADAIGLSGLLVKSVNVMEENLRELNALNITTPVLLGGAALTRKYCETHLRSIYNGNVYYGKDAFEGLHLMNKITGGKTNEINRDIEKRTAGKTTASTASAEPDAGNTEAVKVQVKSSVTDSVDIPQPPFTGTKVVNDIDPEEIYPFINKIALFRGQWGFRRGSLSDEQYSAIIREKAEPVFERLQKTCRENSILQPHVVYGYFRCRSEGDSLIIYDPADDKTEIERFTFPRQQKGKHLCIADYFRSVDSDEPDTIAMTCVTVGSEISRRAKELFETDNYSEYLYLHGFGVEAAEALAEYWHKRIREELDIADQDAREIRKLFAQHYRGCRYSFGYPACPDMEDQVRLFRLLRPERIGCSLSEQFQIHPEQSTSALVVHHPQAGYFTI
ncbi:MAG TPA: methionine synthase, partial [Phycisphaeraceae bacterium]|nr:methionine synthase [Phycisphaeraceae bacterium]